MKESTKRLCIESVGVLENIYLDEENVDPILLKDAIEFCYKHFIEICETENNHDRSVRFDTKQAILNEIERLIKESGDIIKLKVE
jgi:hypothetical protein